MSNFTIILFRLLRAKLFWQGIVFCFVLFSRLAISEVGNFKTVDLSDTISNESVLNAVEDSKGYIWFSSSTGLIRYDGKELKVFSQEENNPNSLSNSWVQTQFIDQQNNHWIGTRYGGINLYDPESNKFKSFQHDLNDSTTISSNWITKFYQTKDGTLWIGTYNGLNRYNKSTKDFTYYPYENELYKDTQDKRIRDIVEDKKGNLWVATEGLGLNYFIVNEERFINYKVSENNSISSNQVFSLVFDDEDDLYIGTAFGLDKYSSSEQKFSKIKRSKPEKYRSHYSQVKGLLFDSHGGLWVASFEGLERINLKDNSIKYFSENASNENYKINHNQIHSVFEDSNSNIWVLSQQGINFFSRNDHVFDFVSLNQLAEIGTKFSEPVFVDSNNVLWIASSIGILSYSMYENKLNVLSHVNQSEKYSTVFSDREGNIYFGGKELLTKVVVDESLVYDIEFDSEIINSLNGATFLSGFQDPSLNFWLGTSRGVVLLNENFKLSKHFLHKPEDPYSLSQNKVNTISFDGENVWFGTRDGLNKYDANEDRFYRFLSTNDDSGSNEYVSIHDSHIDSNGAFWLGTFGSGLIYFDPKTKAFKRYGISNGLEDNTVSGVTEGNDGRIWLNTEKALSRLDPKTGDIQIYDEDRGLHNNIGYYKGFNYNKYNDTVLTFGTKGIDIIRNVFPEPKKTQKLVLNELYIQNELVETSAEKSDFQIPKTLDFVNEISLPYHVDLFSIKFSSIDFFPFSKTRFAYRLKNFSDDWVIAENGNNTADFINIPAGDYVFELKQLSADGRYLDQTKKLRIIMEPSIWETWWAFLFYLAAFFSALVLLFNLIMKKRQAIAEKVNQQNLTAKLFKNSSEGVWLIDSKGKLVSANDKFSQMTGLASNDVIGRKLSFPNISKNEHVKGIESIIENVEAEGNWKGEVWLKNQLNEAFPIEVLVDKVQLSDGAGVEYLGIFSDITERKNNEKQLNELAFYDSLTKLPNRARFASKVEEVISKALPGKLKFAIIFIDLDNFKLINDNFGHNHGDELLKKTALKLMSLENENVFFARFGGDEFLAFYQPENSENVSREELKFLAVNFSNTIKKAISDTEHAMDETMSVTASFGVSLYPYNATEYQKLLQYSDIAMFNAKQAAPNFVKIFDQALSKKIQEKVTKEISIKLGLEREQFVPYFQPKLSLSHSDVQNVEVLSRWHLNGKVISPKEFISIAEKSGLIGDIGEQILEASCKALVQDIKKGNFNGRMAINYSPLQFEYGGIISIIDRVIDRTGFPYENLEIEITESALMRNTEQSFKILNQLKERNIHISIDDFGTGYSSLSYLSKYPINSVKIDASFIKNLEVSEKDRILISSIVNLAHSLNLSVVGEGIETQGQLDYLKSVGCNEIQGYFYHKPMPYSEYSELLETNSALGKP